MEFIKRIFNITVLCKLINLSTHEIAENESACFNIDFRRKVHRTES